HSYFTHADLTVMTHKVVCRVLASARAGTGIIIHFESSCWERLAFHFLIQYFFPNFFSVYFFRHV
ncbi:MAG: hypothetical protein WD966_00125, partial [Nitrosopumilaceae archaeon]